MITLKFDESISDITGIPEMDIDEHNIKMVIRNLRSNLPNFETLTEKYPELAFVLDSKEELIVDSVIPDNAVIAVTPYVSGSFGAEIAFIASAASAIGVSATTMAFMANMLIMVVFQSITSLLAPKPKVTQTAPQEQSNSFIFNGPINVTSVGGSIGIIYGTAMIGSTVGAADLKSIDIPIG